MGEIKANPGKQLIMHVEGTDFLRIPIKTHIICPDDQLEEILERYVRDVIVDGDLLFIAEKIIACLQKRLIKQTDVKPRKIALFLSQFVSSNPADIHDPGLALPETMEMVIREVGTPRVLVATFASAVGKLLKKKGWFYKVAGPIARDIDGPTPYVISPYTEYIILAPSNPQEVAEKAQAQLTNDVAIVDVNDLGGNVLGNTSRIFSDELIVQLLKDNPLGQSNEQTPLGIIRRI